MCMLHSYIVLYMLYCAEKYFHKVSDMPSMILLSIYNLLMFYENNFLQIEI